MYSDEGEKRVARCIRAGFCMCYDGCERELWWWYSGWFAQACTFALMCVNRCVWGSQKEIHFDSGSGSVWGG